MGTEICIFNPTTNLIDVITGAATGPGAPGTPVVLNSSGTLDTSFLPEVGISATAGEDLGLNAVLVNLYYAGGILKCQRAYAASGGIAPSGATYPVLAQGFVNTPVSSGQSASVLFSGTFLYSDLHSEFSISDVGVEVYLSQNYKGEVTKTIPSGAGQAQQSIGYVLEYASGIVTVVYIPLGGASGGALNFSQISGVAQINQGGTSQTTAQAAVAALGAAYGTLLTKPLPDTNYALTTTESENGVFIFTGALTADRTISFPATARSSFVLLNSTTGGHNLPVKTSAGGSMVSLILSPGQPMIAYCDGTNVLVVPQPQVSFSANYTGVTGTLGPVTMFTPGLSGVYRLSYYEEVTTAGPSGTQAPFGYGFFGMGTYNGDEALQTQVSWTDDVGPRTAIPVSTPLDTTSANYDQGDIVIRTVAGQAVAFTTALAATGPSGPAYSIFMRAEKL